MHRISKDYWEKRVEQLDLSRGTALQAAQLVLDKHYPDKTKAKSLNKSVLKVITPSAVIASELRLNQIKLLAELKQAANYEITKLQIQITQLN